MRKNPPFFSLGCLMLALGVILGAFAAHGLQSHLSAHYLSVFQTGVSYQIYHGLGLIVIGVCPFCQGKLFNIGAWLLLAGIFLFSGSLYLLTLFEIKALGIVTPFGGLAFIMGWLCLAWAGFGADKITTAGSNASID